MLKSDVDVKTFVDKLNTPFEMLAAIMEKLRNEVENHGAQEMYSHHENGGKCDAWSCDPSVVQDLDKRLEEAGIQHACFQYPDSNGKGKPNSILVVTREEDRDAVRMVRDACLKEIGSISRFSLDELKRQNVDGEIHSIRNVSQTYSAVFQEEAKRVGLAIAITDNKDGTLDIHYSGREQSKAAPVLMKTIASTRGVMGYLNEHRVAQEAQAEKAIYDSVADPQKDFYIVSASQPNEYMHFTPERYEHYRNERLISDELRSNRNFQQDAHNRVSSAFIKPVVLERDEFERLREMPKKEYKKEIEKKRSKTVHLSSIDTHKLELERLAHQLVEFKMSMDNNSINNNFYDSSVSFSAFVNQEIATDKLVEDRADRENEMSLNPKELPADVQVTIDKCDSLPKEDQEYIKQSVKEYYDEIRDLNIEVTEVTREELHEDLDAVIAGLADSRTTTFTEEREDTIEERSLF